jgi:hypothetical protein
VETGWQAALVQSLRANIWCEHLFVLAQRD